MGALCRVRGHESPPSGSSPERDPRRRRWTRCTPCFATTRQVLRAAGPGGRRRAETRSARWLSTSCNRGIRPFLARWHTEVRDGEVPRSAVQEFHRELADLQSELERYVDARRRSPASDADARLQSRRSTAHVIWHPACEEAAAVRARPVRPAVRGSRRPVRARARIPVRLWRSTSGVPASARRRRSRRSRRRKRNAVILLIDDEFISDARWHGFLDEVAARSGNRPRVLTATLTDERAGRSPPRSSTRTLIRLHALTTEVRSARPAESGDARALSLPCRRGRSGDGLPEPREARRSADRRAGAQLSSSPVWG